MISIIVSSYKPKFYAAFEKNLHQTIGVEFEIIRIENPALMGICEAYNLGGAKAKYNLLCFCHEDIRFDTENWGKILLKQFRTLQNLGIIGVAGSKYKSALPTGWTTGLLDQDVYSIWSEKNGDLTKWENWPYAESVVPIKTLDGVFLAMSSQIWRKYKFDEELEGFHNYDISIALRVAKEYTNYVTKDLKIIHYSNGNFGNDWVRKIISFHKTANDLGFEEDEKKNSIRAFWYRRLRSEKISLVNRVRYILSMGVDKTSLKQLLAFLITRQ